MAHTLPTELIEQIFASTEDRSTWLAVSLTNRLGNRTVSRLLYREVGISGQNHALPDRKHRLHLLVRTLLENPTLAGYAEDIQQDLYPGMGNSDSEAYGRDISLSVVERKMQDLGMGETGIAGFLCELVKDQHICNAWHFFLLLLLCPNAKTLTLGGNASIMKSYNLFKDLAWAAQRSSRPCGLQQVDQVCLQSTFQGTELPTTEDVLPLLWLPTLAKLTIHSMKPSIFSAILLGHSTQVPDSSALTALELHDFRATENDLGIVLRACFQLESLTIHFANADVDTFAHLGQGVSRCQGLRFLRLQCDAAADEDRHPRAVEAQVDQSIPATPPYQPLDSIKDLRQLEALVISKNILFGTWLYKRCDLAGMLPRALRSLKILDTSEPVSGGDIALFGDSALEGIAVDLVTQGSVSG